MGTRIRKCSPREGNLCFGCGNYKNIAIAIFINYFMNNGAWHGETKLRILIMQQRSPFILNRRIGYVATKIATTQCPQQGFHVQTQGHAKVRVSRERNT